MRRRWWLVLFLGFLVVVGGLVFAAGQHPTLMYYRSLFWSRIYYRLRPPEAQVFLPQSTPVPVRPTAVTTPTPSPTASPVAEPQPTATAPAAGTTTPPTSTPTPTATPLALPPRFELWMPRHEYQKWNNCGPATLSMALAFWGWSGNQDVVARWTKPNPRDKNVSPEDLARFVRTRVPGLRLLWRPAGTLTLLKALIAGGFPVMVEKGFYAPRVEGWMGHYLLLYGYDDERGVFLSMDSYPGPAREVPYERLEQRWRDFNYIFLVVYPKDQEAQVLQILGPLVDETTAWQQALARAQEEIPALTGADGFFARFNLGEALVYLGRYDEAARAFDEAFRYYAGLPLEERPWRVMWYRDAPFIAYYHAGRYEDVIRLADTTLAAMSEPVLEEAFYWRGMAKAALGQEDRARRDFRKALALNPLFDAARQALNQEG